jgi:hypothetical protein
MKAVRISCFLFILLNNVKADVIYSPYTQGGLVLSLEGIWSYERPFSSLHTVNFWGGFGAVSVFNELSKPAYGGEIAVELRQYFSRGKYGAFNLGIYSGLAYMRYPTFYKGRLGSLDNSVGIVPGIKLSYKSRLKSGLMAEPYVGISTPWYSNDIHKLSEIVLQSEPGLMLTIGLRIGFNKVWKKEWEPV